MKSILCFGDSNTWGANPSGGRFGRDTRWPGVLRNILNNEYEVVEEGLCGRTTVWEDPIEGDKCGKRHINPCLESHFPLDLVIIMLGTNDMKYRFSLNAFDIAKGAGMLVQLVQKSGFGPGGNAPKILLIAPPPLGRMTGFSEMFKGGMEKSKELSKYFRIEAASLNCNFIDAGEIIISSDIDGIHFEKSEHEKLGKAVGDIIKKII